MSPELTLLATWTGTNNWETKTITNLSDYREIMLCFTTNNGAILNPAYIPYKLFKSTNSSGKFFGGRFRYATADYEADIYYISDTSVGFWASNGVTANIYGLI